MRRLAALAVVALLAPACPAPASGAAAASAVGINVHLPAGEALAALFSEVERGGFGWVRIDVSWAAVEFEPGHYDWRRADDVVAEAQRRGLSVLGILAYTPGWATDGPPLAGVPRDALQWSRFCEHAAARYAGQVEAWEIWNEPNLGHFWAGSRSEWIELVLRPAAAAVRRGDPAALLVGPALAHLGEADWHHWLYAVLGEAAGELDVVSHHVYAASDEAVTERLAGRSAFAEEPALWGLDSPSLREVLELAGWRGPVWLTETGWQGRGVGELFQAARVRGLLDEWLTGRPGRQWLERVFFYELQDAGPTHWGFLRADRSRKPAWTAARDFARRLAPRPPPGPRRRPSGAPRVDKERPREHPMRGS